MANWCVSDDILNTTSSLIISVSPGYVLSPEIQKWHQNCPKIYWFRAIGNSEHNLPVSIYL